ncbi:MAG: aldo/keto reductase, partial [Pygmaiobacter sp.]|nr:aldo/keto reductase [Pygmaiobacter sp.]
DAHGIATESWSPLGRGNDMLQNPAIAEIARTNGKSISQVILRWHTQHGAVPLPKASTQVHQAENFDIFDFTLSASDMAAVDELTRPNGRTFDQDPAVYQEF